MALVGNALNRCIDFLLHQKFRISEFLGFVKGTEFHWWRIADAGEDDAHPLSILVFGREMIADDVVAAFFSNLGFVKTRLEQCLPKEAVKAIDVYRHPGDAMVIMEKPWWRRSVDGGHIVIQTLLNTELEIRGRDYDDIVAQEVGRSTRKLLADVKNCWPAMRETKDLEDILRFSRTLLASSAAQTHGAQANVPTEAELRAVADKLILFTIEEDGRPIAGMLNIYSERTSSIRMWRIGMSEELLKKPSLRSQYHMAFFIKVLRLACDMGLARVSHGMTAPIMNHGNLLSKLRRACRPAFEPNYPQCTVQFYTDDLPGLLGEHPLLVVVENDFVGLMGIGRDLATDAVEAHLNSFFKACTYKGLKMVRCLVHHNWYDHGGKDAVQDATLKLYGFSRVDRREETVELVFERRQGE